MSAICDVHKEVGIELLYNSVHWKFNQLETRCGTESQHPAEGVLWPPIEQLQLRCGRENQHPAEWAPRRTGKKRSYGHKSGGQYVAVLFGLQLPLTHNPFKKSERCVIHLYCIVFCMHMCLYSWSWLYNTLRWAKICAYRFVHSSPSFC